MGGLEKGRWVGGGSGPEEDRWIGELQVRLDVVTFDIDADLQPVLEVAGNPGQRVGVDASDLARGCLATGPASQGD